MSRCPYHLGATYGPRCTLDDGHGGLHAWEERPPLGDPMAEGVPAAGFEGHPGVNEHQRRSVRALLAGCPEARLLGMSDGEVALPVVRVRSRHTGEVETFAVDRGGAPVDAGRVRERWTT